MRFWSRPFLFSFFVDTLTEILSSKSVGEWMANLFCGFNSLKGWKLHCKL